MAGHAPLDSTAAATHYMLTSDAVVFDTVVSSTAGYLLGWLATDTHNRRGLSARPLDQR